MLTADNVRVGAPTLVETSLLFVARRKTRNAAEVAALVRELEVTVVPFGARHWHAAVEAFLQYGRGRHKASLNFGDCLAYAVASVANDALLFVGRDFALTDITPA
jgi:ribonuclease VapC